MNTSSATLPEGLQSLIDDPLAAARTAASEGARVVAYIGDGVPVALIAASGALPLRLRGVARMDTRRADRYLESAHAPELRVIVEQWLGGELDFIESVVFPRTDDSAQRLYYYLCELQRRRICAGPRPLLYDVANIGRPTSSEYTRESTRRLARELSVTDASPGPAMGRVAARDALLSDIRARGAARDPIPGSLAWALERASACDWRESFDPQAYAWLNGACSLSSPRRILVAGDPSPDGALHREVESAGGSVVADLTDSVPAGAPPRSASLDALADHFHSRRNPVLAMRENARWVAERATDACADAVILWLIEEDESLPWEIARQVRTLRTAGIPTLLLARQSWVADESARRQVREFVASLEGKQ